MKEMTSAEMPDESVLVRPMLESLEPRRLLSAGAPESMTAFAEFVVVSPASAFAADAAPTRSGFPDYASPPLGARRTFEGFGSSMGERSFSIAIFVTPWSMPSSTSDSQPIVSSPSNATDGKQSSAHETTPETPATTPTLSLATTNTDVTRAVEPVQPTSSASVFATNVVEAVDTTPHEAAKSSAKDASHASVFAALAPLTPELQSTDVAPHGTVSRAWFEAIDRDILREQQKITDASVAIQRDQSIPIREADQAESLRTIARRMAQQADIVHAIQPMTASVESTPVSIWQRFAMVTLTGGAVVANWYVRRRRAKLALNGMEKGSVGRFPHLP